MALPGTLGVSPHAHTGPRYAVACRCAGRWVQASHPEKKRAESMAKPPPTGGARGVFYPNCMLWNKPQAEGTRPQRPHSIGQSRRHRGRAGPPLFGRAHAVGRDWLGQGPAYAGMGQTEIVVAVEGGVSNVDID